MDRLRLSWIVVLVVTAAAVHAAAGSPWKRYETAVGGSQVVPLGDGTTVKINTNSEFRSRIGTDRDDIVMVRGEALFQVSRNAAMPLVVDATSAVLRTSDAEFDVRIRDTQSVDVLVTKGQLTVVVKDPKGVSDSIVGAGKIARFRGKDLAISDTSHDEVAQALAWTEGYLWFQRLALGDIVEEFNRYSERQLIIEDPSLVGSKLSGKFVATDAGSFVNALGQLGISAQDKTEPSGRSVLALRRRTAL